MKTRRLILCLIAAASCAARGEVDWIEKLRAPEQAIRRVAIDQIQTLGDPRIPEACLPLLRDEGKSIRRQAARAIGSRFAEIAERRRPVFIEALKECAASGPKDVTLLAQRAIGLLTSDYSSPAFSKSPDGKWVLYERRRLPVVANIAGQTHRLLSPALELHAEIQRNRDSTVAAGNWDYVEKRTPLLKLKVTSEPAEDLFRPHWHPRDAALAFSVRLQAKFFDPICLWRARDGAVKVWSVKSFQSLYGTRFPHWATVVEFARWEGSKAIIKIYDCDDAGSPDEPFDPKGMLVSVDLETWEIARVP